MMNPLHRFHRYLTPHPMQRDPLGRSFEEVLELWHLVRTLEQLGYYSTY